MTLTGIDFDYLLCIEYPACRINSRHCIVKTNDSFKTLCGMDESELAGKCLWEILKPDEDCRDQIQTAGETQPYIRLLIKVKDVKLKERTVSVSLIHDRMTGDFFAEVSDITHIFNLQNLLRNGELFLNSIFESINISIGFFDKKGRIRFINNHFCSMVGLPPEKIKGHFISEFTISPETYWLDDLYNVEKATIEHIELNFSAGMDEAHFITTPHILYDDGGEISGAVFILTDITEMKIKEKKLYISDEKFSKAFYASPAPSTVTTINEGRFIEVNESFGDLVGYDPSNLIGHYVWELGLFIKWEHRREMIEKLKKKGKLRDYEIQLKSKSKGIRTFNCSAEIIELQGEECMLWVSYDITEKINFEKEMLRITEKERYRLGQYLHDDLGQFLVGIDSICTLIEKKMSKKNQLFPLVTEMHQYIKEATDSSRRTSQGLCPVYLDENGLRSGIKKMLIKKSQIFNIEYKFTEKTDIVIYNSNTSINIYYIVQEAVNNAIKHGKASMIEVTSVTDSSSIIFTIADNGKGFTTSDRPNTGIGIDQMKYRSRAIGGSLHLCSEPGRGTMVTLKLPRKLNRVTDRDWNKTVFTEKEL